MGIFDKAKDMLNSEKVENVSDSILDKVEELADKTLGAEHAEKIDSVRKTIDDKIGNE